MAAIGYNATRAMRWSTVLWVIVPGVGQIHLGRAGKGILLFTLFALLLNASLICPLLLPDAVVRMALVALTVLAWLISSVDFVRESAEADVRTIDARRHK